MKNKKFYIGLIVCLLPIVVGVIFYDQLPALIPSHWNGAGEVDGYLDKAIMVFGMPFLMAGIHTLVVWAMSKDPKTKNIPNVMFNLMYLFTPVLTIFLVFITANAVMENGLDINIGVATQILVGIVFLVIGNYMPKCKQSYTVGVKTPWALHDEENWNKTHRFAGFLWIVGGLFMFVLAFLQMKMDTTYIMFGSIIVMAFAPYMYSYLLYSKKQKK